LFLKEWNARREALDDVAPQFALFQSVGDSASSGKPTNCFGDLNVREESYSDISHGVLTC
jgi:hypothetical protein